ncbi:MAG TPA: hypothetical protein PL143_10475, partial [Rhodocyclaceae bacterium]|nr:hypothetical protein [Rhodocyclaceae bacterium]
METTVSQPRPAGDEQGDPTDELDNRLPPPTFNGDSSMSSHNSGAIRVAAPAELPDWARRAVD